jgi:hypothetical protein
MQIGFQSIFDTPTVRQFSMNGKYQTPDGRIWEYLYATEAITKGMIVTRPASTAVTTVSSSSNGASQVVYITEASAGWTVGAYQDHWAYIHTGTGEGQAGKIKDNSADTLELFSDYALATSLAVADSGVTIVPQPNMEKAAVTTDITPFHGVAQVTFASGDYGFVLKRGVGFVTCGIAITINTGIKTGDDTEGYGTIAATGEGLFDANWVGRCLVANASADKACFADVGAN